MKDQLIKLETYGVYIEETDNQLIKEFLVPNNWLKFFVRKNFNMSISEFKNEYTWDTTEIVFYQAEADGVAIVCKDDIEQTNYLEW